MNKKLVTKLIGIIIVIIVVVFAWLFISFWNARQESLKQINNSNAPVQYPTARDAANWQAPFMRQIEVKFMDPQEKAKMGLANDPTMRLQVLERDASGNVTAYKKITSEDQIVQYIYDPAGNGTNAAGDIASTTKASGTPIIK